MKNIIIIILIIIVIILAFLTGYFANKNNFVSNVKKSEIINNKNNINNNLDNNNSDYKTIDNKIENMYSENTIIENPVLVKNRIGIIYPISEQELAVNDLRVDQKIFLVIQKNDNGKKGKVIGVSNLISPGNYQDISIKLTEKYEWGSDAYLTFYQDSNNNNKYDKNDQVALDEEGKEIFEKFNIRVNAI